jgi:hypothetical protein
LAGNNAQPAAIVQASHSLHREVHLHQTKPVILVNFW